LARILVVDDEPGILTLLRTVLRLNDHQVFTASSSALGMQLLRRQSFDVLLLDLRIGEEDGREFYRRARADNFRGAVVIVSAYGALSAARELGADGAISKPFEPHELTDEIERAISRRAAQNQQDDHDRPSLFSLVRRFAWS
jgi:DNA-binding response OmpR family regulator